MKWWHWLLLELLIIFGVIAWIYFFPSEIEDDFAKGMIGFVLFYAIENCRDINRRKTMVYKKVMTCGECLKYEFCPVANHNANHKACMKITTEENYTIEQNAGENRIEGGVLSVSGWVSEPWYVIEDDGKYYVQNYIGTTGNGIEKVMCKGTREECQKWKEEHEQKKEKHYQPFNNCDELIEHFVGISGCINGITFRPLIWVKHKHYGTENLITAFDNDNESIGGSCVFIQDIWVDMKELFDNFTFLDGSPCGVEE